jgi:polyferredoxin
MKQPFTTMVQSSDISSHKIYHWALGIVMVAIISAGWKYPILGYAVPLTMIVTIVGAIRKGRFVCGNLCPRGTFLDTFFQFIGGNRPIPQLLFNPILRWTTMLFLMTFMTYQISRNPSDPAHWGVVFWTMCCATTAVALVIGIAYRPRAWCALCPAGTMANAIGGHKYPLHISAKCNECGTCSASCPMGFSAKDYRSAGVFSNRDCLKCSTCENNCSNQALSFRN